MVRSAPRVLCWLKVNKSIDKVTTKRMVLYTGRAHPELAREVASHLNISLGTLPKDVADTIAKNLTVHITQE